MEQLNVAEDKKIEIDFSAGHLTESVKAFRPLVYRDQEQVICVLGPDLEKGIVGYGADVDAALANWDKNLEQRIMNHGEDDEVARFIIDTRRASVKKVG